MRLYEEAQKEGKSLDPAEFGFVFSMEPIQERLAYLKASRDHLDPEIEVLKTAETAKPPEI